MRLSVRERDAGYKPLAFCNRAVVTLDGKPVTNCFMADEGLGEVRCYADPLRFDSTGEGVQEIVMRGEVVISFPETI